jgi:cytochrome c biogenesis protein CcdA
MNFIILPLLYAFFFAFLTAYIASKKNYKIRNWFWLGFLLGFIATGILLFQPTKTEPKIS